MFNKNTFKTDVQLKNIPGVGFVCDNFPKQISAQTNAIPIFSLPKVMSFMSVDVFGVVWEKKWEVTKKGAKIL